MECFSILLQLLFYAISYALLRNGMILSWISPICSSSFSTFFIFWVCQEFCVNFLEVFVVFFHQRAKPFINEQLVSNHRPIG